MPGPFCAANGASKPSLEAWNGSFAAANGSFRPSNASFAVYAGQQASGFAGVVGFRDSWFEFPRLSFHRNLQIAQRLAHPGEGLFDHGTGLAFAFHAQDALAAGVRGAERLEHPRVVLATALWKIPIKKARSSVTLPLVICG